MNKLIFYPLIIMIVLATFNQIFLYSNTDLTHETRTQVNPQTGEIIQNNESTSISTSGTTGNFDVNMLAGYIAIITAIVVVGVLAGITVLGSGISEHAQKLLFKSTWVFGLWAIFSALTYTIFASFPVFGQLGWFLFTAIYTFGFFHSSEGGA